MLFQEARRRTYETYDEPYEPNYQLSKRSNANYEPDSHHRKINKNGPFKANTPHL